MRKNSLTHVCPLEANEEGGSPHEIVVLEDLVITVGSAANSLPEIIGFFNRLEHLHHWISCTEIGSSAVSVNRFLRTIRLKIKSTSQINIEANQKHDRIDNEKSLVETIHLVMLVQEWILPHVLKCNQSNKSSTNYIHHRVKNEFL